MSQAAQLPQGLGPEKYEKTLNYLRPQPPDHRPPIPSRAVLGLVAGGGTRGVKGTRRKLTP